MRGTIAWVAVLSSALAVLGLGPQLAAQGCAGVMTSNFSTYVSASEDSNGVLHATVTVDGTAIIHPSEYCNISGVHHQGQVYNNFNNNGGWTYGPYLSPYSYISESSTEDITGIPGVIYYDDFATGIYCTAVGDIYAYSGKLAAADYTTPQHSYPRSPFGQACWVSQFFDSVVRAGVRHGAEDVVFQNSSGGGVSPPYGTPVYAMEAGTVAVVVSYAGPSGVPYPQCAGTSSPANYVKIKGADGWYTVYVHVRPAVVAQQPVSQGQLIGYLDNSGCQSGAHTHIAREDVNRHHVNFTIPCANPTPTNKFWDGLVDDDVPDTY